MFALTPAHCIVALQRGEQVRPMATSRNECIFLCIIYLYYLVFLQMDRPACAFTSFVWCGGRRASRRRLL